MPEREFAVQGPQAARCQIALEQDAVRNQLPLLDDLPATVQERAWTSPIWYMP